MAAKKDKTPTPDPKTEEAFSRISTYFGKVDLLVTAIGLIGGSSLGEQLNQLIDASEVSAPTTDVQAARDAQQAALDAEAALRRGGGSNFKMPEDPRDAEISPIETEHEDADKVHGESVNDGLTDAAAAPSVPYTGAPEPEEATTDVVIEAPAGSKVKS